MLMFGNAEYVTVSKILNHCVECLRIILSTTVNFLIICRLDHHAPPV